MEYLLNQPNSLSDTERERLSNELYEKYKLGLSPVNLLASASLSMHDLIPEKALALASLEPEKSFYIHLNSLHSLDSRNFLDSYLKSSNSDKDKEYVALKLIEYYFNIKEYSLCLRYRSFVDSPLFSLCDQFQSTSDPLAIIKNIASKKDYIHVSTLLLSLQVTCRSILNKFAKEAFSNNSTDAALLMWFHMSCLDEELHLMFHSFSSTRGLEILNSATTSTYDLLSNFANQTSAILSNPQISDFHNMICTLFKPTPTKKDVIPETIQNDTPNLDLIKVKRMFITNIPFSTKPILVERITNLFRSGITVSSYMKSQAKCYTTTATSNLDFQAAILLHSMDRNSGVVSSSAIDTVAAEHIFFQESSRRNVNVTLNVTNLVKLFQMNSKISIFLFEKIIGLLVYDVLKNGKVSLEALILFMNQNIQDQNLNIHNSCAIFGGLVAAIFSSFNKDVLFTGNLDISLQQFTLFATQLCFLIGNCDNHCSLVKIVSVVDDIGLTRFLSACLIAILNSNGENIVHISPLVSQLDLFGHVIATTTKPALLSFLDKLLSLLSDKDCDYLIKEAQGDIASITSRTMESRKCYIQSLAYSLRFFIDPLTDNDIRLIVKLINTCKVLDEFGYVAVCGQMLPSPDYKNMFIALARIVDENIDQIYLPFIYNENALEYVGSLFKKKGLVLKLDQVIKIVTEDGNKLPEAVSELKRMKFFNYMLEKF